MMKKIPIIVVRNPFLLFQGFVFAIRGRVPKSRTNCTDRKHRRFLSSKLVSTFLFLASLNRQSQRFRMHLALTACVALTIFRSPSNSITGNHVRSTRSPKYRTRNISRNKRLLNTTKHLLGVKFIAESIGANGSSLRRIFTAQKGLKRRGPSSKQKPFQHRCFCSEQYQIVSKSVRTVREGIGGKTIAGIPHFRIQNDFLRIVIKILKSS